MGGDTRFLPYKQEVRGSSPRAPTILFMAALFQTRSSDIRLIYQDRFDTSFPPQHAWTASVDPSALLNPFERPRVRDFWEEGK